MYVKQGENVQICLFENELINYILLSLQEKPYNEIKSGEKIYEYRTRYQKVPTTAFIYVSQTVKKITGIIEFDTPIIGTDEEISRLAESLKEGSYQGMKQYLNKGIGYAIQVKKLIEIEPVSLQTLRERFSNLVVPQSYYLINNKKELLDFLLAQPRTNEIVFRR